LASADCLARRAQNRTGWQGRSHHLQAHNLDLEFNSLDAQREACEAYIKSQAHEGWRLIPDHYDDGGLSGASLDRPALQNLLADVRTGKITVVVVYKVDRLTRSLADFAKLVELFDQYGPVLIVNSVPLAQNHESGDSSDHEPLSRRRSWRCATSSMCCAENR
jgi:DNA invertase Pin-like site-specific DNA recombinase